MTVFWLALLPVLWLGAVTVLALLAASSDRASFWIGSVGGSLGCLLGVGASLFALAAGIDGSFRIPWSLPIGEFHVGIDPLSSFFLLCVFLVSGLASVYGTGYLRTYFGKRPVLPAIVFFNILIISMALVVAARDGVLFLMAWETMTIGSFFLVTYHNEREEVRKAGMTYLVASQLGVLFLFFLFAVLSRGTGMFGFDYFLEAGNLSAGLASLCFFLALVGFGAKAGFWPFHVWLPEAHPAAPSHISALMSGVMIKMGIYGLVRILGFLGPAPEWWGVLLIGIGAVSGVTGVLHALAQHDLKRLLAYHSVENIGIITLGLGLGLLGQSQGNPAVTFLGYAGALLHVLNHGLFKGLLFQSAGCVLQGTGTRDMNSLGGLSRTMPVTALMFLIGSVAICGLPPLNGFVSEWFVYLGAFRGAGTFHSAGSLAALAVLPTLALIGGLAAACFVKAYGVTFLGEPRTGAGTKSHEPGKWMTAPMAAGAALCAVIGIWPDGALRWVGPVAASLTNGPEGLPHGFGPLGSITRTVAVFFVLLGGSVLARNKLLRNREVAAAPTWGCGYPDANPRMQYTAPSFAEPVLAPFRSILLPRVHREGPVGYFPESARFEEHLGDKAAERFWFPGIGRAVWSLNRLRVVQHGRIQLYLVYIFGTLLVLLVWQLSGMGR